MPTTISNAQLIFAFLVFFTFSTVGMLTQKVSGKESIQRQREQWARMGTTPEHAWLDDSASFGANVICCLWCATGAYLAVAILWGNLFWVLVTLKALGIMH